MGEASAKRRALQEEQRIFQTLRHISLSPPTPHQDWVQALVLDLDDVERARQALGGLPGALTRDLPSAATLGEAHAICWERWPGGRVACHFLTSVEEAIELYPRYLYSQAAARGCGVRLAAFPDPGWATALEQADREYAPLIDAAALAIERTPMRVERPNGAVVAFIPPLVLSEDRVAAAGQVLRVLDSLVATRDSAQANVGRFHLSFDGLEQDPREVWDVPACAELVRRLHEHAPWWVWVAAPDQIYTWLGALFSTGPTAVNVNMEVAIPLDSEAAERELRATVQKCLPTLHACGLDIDSREVLARLATFLQLAEKIVEISAERLAALETGDVARANPEDVLEFQQHGEDARDPDGDAAIHSTLVFDRSAAGRAAVEFTIADEATATSVRAGLRQWLDASEPLVVASGFVGDGTSWRVEPLELDDAGLLAAFKRATTEAISRHARAGTLALGVAEDLKPRLSQLSSDATAAATSNLPGAMNARDLIEQLQRESQAQGNAADESGVHSQSHRGLLDLAVAPGGIEIEFDHVQIINPEDFGQVADLAMQAAAEKTRRLAKSDLIRLSARDMEPDLRAWRREDGSLLVREMEPPRRELVVPAGAWRLLDDKELRELTRDASRRDIAPEFMQDVSRSMAAALETRKQSKSQWDKLHPAVTSVVAIFGRGTRSLFAIREFIGGNDSVRDTVERWLASDESYFVFWRAKDGRAAGMVVDSEESLMADALQQALGLCDSPATTLLVGLTDSEADSKALAWWTQHGGLVVPQAVPRAH